MNSRRAQDYFVPCRSSLQALINCLLLPGLIVLLSACSPSLGGAAKPAPEPTTAPTEPALAPPRAGSYAALGASETYGVGAQPRTSAYAYLVARVLGARRFVNVGIPGTTLDAGYQTELTSALSIRPQLCTVFFGVNDLRAGITRTAFLQDLYDLAATLRSAHAQVLIIGMPDLSHLPAVRSTGIGDLKQISDSWNVGMRQVARETGSHLLDLRQYDGEIATHPEYISADGLHPSNIGYARLAQVVVAAVRQQHLWKGS